MAARPLTPERANTPPHSWHQRATAAQQAGDIDGALDLVRQGVREHPGGADLMNTAGNICMKAARFEEAAQWFGKAAAAAPDRIDLAINHAIALNRLHRFDEAREALAPFEAQGRGDARFHSVAGSAARGAGAYDEAASHYEAAIAANPSHANALHGLARLALERGDADAVSRFDAALAVNQANAELWLGKAQAMEAAGDTEGAIGIVAQLVTQGPQWIEGLKVLAQLRLSRGEQDYTSHFREAAKKVPNDPSIPLAHAGILALGEHYEQSAEVALEAQRSFPDDEEVALSAAFHAGAAGHHDLADKLFGNLSLDTPDRHVHEARHILRSGDAERASRKLARAFALDPWNQTAWALQAIAWRVAEDAQLDWLMGGGALARPLDLEGGVASIEEAVPVLDWLHDASPFPLGQSLRGGTQTRGILFARRETALRDLERAIEATLQTYRETLPPQDESHPFLRHRNAPWHLTGSWSVRLSGGSDHHASHIHPGGILSSALYVRVPEGLGDSDKAGWLELGRPPRDLLLDLGPMQTIEPKVGRLALFPSFLYHGTRPFAEGRRMSVAFDVGAKTSRNHDAA